MNLSSSPIFIARSLPVLQNRTYDSEEEALKSPVGDVELGYDCRTGIITNRQFNSEAIIYDKNYNNEQALSAAFLQHLENVSAIIQDCIPGVDLVEIGCGKGTFLKLLRKRGFQVTGFDPAFEGDDSQVKARNFGCDDRLKADGVVLRHVLEHVHDPFGFLAMVRDANRGNGRIYIEVPSFEWILEQGAWFDIFYEHVNYFRETDFRRIFGEIVKMERSFNGQYLSIVAELGSLRTDEFPSRVEVAPELVRNLSASMQGSINMVKSLLIDELSGRFGVWGGASKGVIFSLHLKNAGIPIDAVVDINPAKHEKYLPCSGIQVRSPEEYLENLSENSIMAVMNPNYLDEIRKRTGGRIKLITA